MLVTLEREQELVEIAHQFIADQMNPRPLLDDSGSASLYAFVWSREEDGALNVNLETWIGIKGRHVTYGGAIAPDPEPTLD